MFLITQRWVLDFYSDSAHINLIGFFKIEFLKSSHAKIHGKFLYKHFPASVANNLTVQDFLAKCRIYPHLAHSLFLTHILTTTFTLEFVN